MKYLILLTMMLNGALFASDQAILAEVSEKLKIPGIRAIIFDYFLGCQMSIDLSADKSATRIDRMVYSSTHKQLAILSETYDQKIPHHIITIYDVENKKITRQFNVSLPKNARYSPVKYFIYQSDGKKLIYLDEQEYLLEWEAPTYKLINAQEGVTNIKVDDDQFVLNIQRKVLLGNHGRFMTCMESKSDWIRIYDKKDNCSKKDIHAPHHNRELKASPNQKTFAVLSLNSGLDLYDLVNGIFLKNIIKWTKTSEGFEYDAHFKFEFSPDSLKLVFLHKEKMYLYNLESKTIIRILEEENEPITNFAYICTGYIAIITDHKKLKIYTDSTQTK
jgi:hypothetical protein